LVAVPARSANAEPARPGPPSALRRAAALVVAEAAALLGIGAFSLVRTGAGAAREPLGAVLGVGFELGTAVVLLVLARGLWRLRGWARGPLVVVQLLALPVGFTLAVEAGRWLYGGPVLLLACSVLYLLLTPEARLALES